MATKKPIRGNLIHGKPRAPDGADVGTDAYSVHVSMRLHVATRDRLDG